MSEETAAEFLTERRDFLMVRVVRAEGAGWDIVLRIDGTYAEREDAEPVAAFMRKSIEAISDIPKDGWDRWNG